MKRCLSGTITFTLSCNVIAKHRSKHEILFRREFVERFVDKSLYGIKAKLIPEIEIHLAFGNGLRQISYS